MAKNLLDTLIEPVPFDTEQERANRRLKLANDELKRANAAYLQHIDRLEREKEVLLALDDRRNVKRWETPITINKGESAAILLISDIHFEEVVEPGKVNGANAYSPDIARESVREVFRRSIHLLRRYRLLADIQEAVIWLGGDLISGTIHEELLENNAMSPIQACVEVEALLEEVLRYFVRHSKVKRLTIAASCGNHDRTTHKTRMATRNDNSYATLIYSHLRKRLADLKQVEWEIGDGQMTYLDVLGHTVRFTHGDGVKYGGGVGGITIPLNKAITRWDVVRKADLTCIGHFHQMSWNRAMKYVVNGSVIGTTPYSLAFGHEPPCQTMVIIDRDRGTVDATPIFAR